MRCLLITVQPREGGEPASREVDVPEHVTPNAVLEKVVFDIRDNWGEEKDHEIIRGSIAGALG